MLQRLGYGFCGAILLVCLAYKGWDYGNLSHALIVEASLEDKQNLDGTGVHVAVIDEGFDLSHTHLRFSPYRYNTDNQTRDISETIIFDKEGYKFESHGTHVTGIILSLAPQVQVIPIKVGFLGGDQAFVRALNRAASSPAQIVNISMRLSHTGRELSPNVRQALLDLAQAGKLVVIAAGNDSSPLLRSAYTKSLVDLTHHPLMKGRLILTGASSYKNGSETRANFSNYPGKGAFGMAQTYFITAPGDKISSAITGGLFGEKSGTSMATPIVVGIASLIKQAFPFLSAEGISTLLLKSARKVSLDGKDLPRHQFGRGIVNFKSALYMGRKEKNLQ